MSKFTELCEAYEAAQQEFANFREASRAFADDLWHGLIDYLEVSPCLITLMKVVKENHMVPTNPPLDSLIRLRKDGFWEFGIGVTVFSASEGYPRDTVFVHLLLRRNIEGKYQVRLAHDSRVFVIQPNEDNPFDAFFDHMFDKVIDSYRTGLQRMLSEEEAAPANKPIGFDISELSEARQPEIPEIINKGAAVDQGGGEE